MEGKKSTTGKEDRDCYRARGSCNFKSSGQRSFLEKRTFKKIPKEYLGKTFPGRGNSKCKGPEVEINLFALAIESK